MRKLAVLLLGLVLLPACAVTHRDFRPVERTGAEAPNGRPAAEYELGREGVRWGEVRVWTDGVTRFSDDPVQTLLHFGVEIENALDGPLSLDLDRTRLAAVEGNLGELDELAPLDATGLLEAPPHAVRRFELEFELPADVSPADLAGFRVRWNMLGPDGWRYEQHTAFRRDRWRFGGMAYPPPFYWGIGRPFGWRAGWGWNWGWGFNWCY